ncbi:hypothetical protein H4219_001378 [Mycoemilia scoparia]|uniref:Major facilitator superfamily (MFS) profile domain-containing protein n=1 Tax=Mycoemilia scoparia TaxID=417184 RepID=A0A9W8A8F8_9FUNG|nr:hypothetical protein H4219_001378 [Mycoemilia scoparia]
MHAGFVPGFIYYISFWYTKRQQGPRLSLFFSAGTFAGIFAGPLAAALTNINGKLKEYQYIFLVEGGVTVFLGIVSIFLLSNYPESARFLTKEEKETAVKLLKREQALSGGRHVILSQVPKFLLDWKLWAYGIIFWISSTAGITQAIFGPTLIASMGYTSTKAQIMSSLPSTCGFVSQLLSMFIPRIFPRLSVLIMIQALFTCACYIVLATTTGNKLRMAFLCLANFGTSPIMPYVSLWMLNNTVGVTQRAVGSGLTIMLGGIGGLIGSHLYREMDKPYYRHGHRIIAVLFGISFLLTLSLAAFFFFENRRRDKLEFGRNHNSDGGQTPGGDVDLDDGDTEVELMGDKLQSHRYTF